MILDHDEVVSGNGSGSGSGIIPCKVLNRDFGNLTH